jgi:Flp pilus assembly protein TadD
MTTPRPAPVANYYSELKVSPTASADEIKKAIHRELRVWSNRTNAPQIERRQEAERKVKLLEEAEAVLLEATKRSEYDRNLRSAGGPEREVGEAELKDITDLVHEGWRLLAAGNVADALFVATRATEQNGSNSDAWALLGQAKYRWGEIEDAIYEYKRAIKLRPNEASYYFDLGSVYESVEKTNDALQQYQRAVQVDPKTTMYRAAVGGLLVKAERYAEGIQILERCAQEEPDNETYQWYLALAYHDGAVTSWWKNPQDGQYYCTSKAQADQAKAVIEKAKGLKFNDPELTGQLAATEKLVNGLYERQFKGSWAFVVLFGFFFFIVGGWLWWYVNRRPAYRINRDIKEVVEAGKADALVGGELGAYFSVLPPGFKWIAYTAPRYVVWIAVLVLSPFTFCYLVYDNYIKKE